MKLHAFIVLLLLLNGLQFANAQNSESPAELHDTVVKMQEQIATLLEANAQDMLKDRVRSDAITPAMEQRLMKVHELREAAKAKLETCLGQRIPSEMAAKATYQLGVLYKYDFEAMDDALTQFQKIIENYSANQELVRRAAFHAGEIYFGKKDYKAALAEFQRVIKDNEMLGVRYNALLGMAECQKQLGCYRDAAVIYNRLIEDYGDYEHIPDVCQKLILLYSDDMQDIAQAIKQFLRLEPTYPAINMMMERGFRLAPTPVFGLALAKNAVAKGKLEVARELLTYLKEHRSDVAKLFDNDVNLIFETNPGDEEPLKLYLQGRQACNWKVDHFVSEEEQKEFLKKRGVASKIFDGLLAQYPESPLADDALMAQAALFKREFGWEDEAKNQMKLFDQLIIKYPTSERRKEAIVGWLDAADAYSESSWNWAEARKFEHARRRAEMLKLLLSEFPTEKRFFQWAYKLLDLYYYSLTDFRKAERTAQRILAVAKRPFDRTKAEERLKLIQGEFGKEAPPLPVISDAFAHLEAAKRLESEERWLAAIQQYNLYLLANNKRDRAFAEAEIRMGYIYGDQLNDLNAADARLMRYCPQYPDNLFEVEVCWKLAEYRQKLRHYTGNGIYGYHGGALWCYESILNAHFAAEEDRAKAAYLLAWNQELWRGPYRLAENYEQVISKFPNSRWADWARFRKIDLYRKRGEIKQAIREYKHLLERKLETPLRRDVQLALGICYLQTKELENARRIFQQLDLDDERKRYVSIQMDVAREEYDTVAEVAKQFAATYSKSEFLGEVAALGAEALLKLQRYSDIREFYLKMRNTIPPYGAGKKFSSIYNQALRIERQSQQKPSPQPPRHPRSPDRPPEVVAEEIKNLRDPDLIAIIRKMPYKVDIVEYNELKTIAHVDISWYTGPLGAASYRAVLIKRDKRWTVVSLLQTGVA